MGTRLADRLRVAALALVIVLILALVVVWAAYLFPSNPLATYWKGLSRVQADHDPLYPYFLWGDYRAGGWRSYFLFAFLLKTPLPTLLLAVLSLGLWRRYRAPHAIDELFLALPAVVFVAFVSALADNQGLRYILPAYPLLFLWVSRLAPFFFAQRWRAILAAGLALWTLVNAVRIFPDHLAYFNELVGGPAHGHEYLDDSNIDWGQDLKRLRAWMEENDVDEITLRYFSTGSPEYYGIGSKRIGELDPIDALPPGTYAVSTHSLVRGQLNEREGHKTDWLSRYQPVARVGYSFFIFRIPGSERSPS